MNTDRKSHNISLLGIPGIKTEDNGATVTGWRETILTKFQYCLLVKLY